MILDILSRTIIGYLIGNITCFFKLFFNREDCIWVSKFYGKYVWKAVKKKRGEWLIFPMIMIMIVVGIYAMNQDLLLLRIWGLLFGGLGLLVFFYGWLHYLDKLYILKDRLELRIFLYPYKVIPFDNVKMILRDIDSGKYTHVIYQDKTYGLKQISDSLSFVEIPAEVFQRKELIIDKSKIHKNIYMDYNEVKSNLPKNPIIKKAPKKWSKMNTKEKMSLLLVFAFNPITVIAIVTILFGIRNINIYLIVLFDLSVRSAQYFGSNFSRQYRVLDYSVLERNS